MNDIRWNEISLAEFRSLARLTKDESAVLEDWADDEPIAHTVTHRNMSEAQVYKLRNQIRQKYDDVQPYTPLLDPRT